MISVIIPYRNEDMLGFTVERVRATIGCDHEIICVDDGSDKTIRVPAGVNHLSHAEPVGNCYSRHRGIEAARYETLWILDAHCNFWDQPWGRWSAAWVADHPQGLGCAVSVQLRVGEMEMAGKGKYYGAHLVRHDIDSWNRRRLLPALWNSSDTVSPGDQIGCVLGGHYLMNRTWYLHGLQGVWEHLRGWGHSEPTISLVNWLCGGDNYLLPLEMGHMYRTGKAYEVPYVSYLSNLIFNQLYLGHICVHDDGALGEMIQHLQLKPRQSDHSAALAQLYGSNWRMMRGYLEGQTRTWQEYEHTWLQEHDQ